jgi:predicted Kef-type K+ transport protein
VAATLGLEFGFITEAFKDAIILLAIITCLMGPTLFKAFYRSEPDAQNTRTRITKTKFAAGWMRQRQTGPDHGFKDHPTD